MPCSDFHGRLRRNAITILQMTQSRLYKPCTLDLLLPHQNTPLLQSLHSTFSPGPSSRVLTNSSLFLTVLGQMMFTSGASFKLHSRSPCPGTFHASKMDAFWLNSTSGLKLQCFQSTLLASVSHHQQTSVTAVFNRHTPNLPVSLLR